MGKVDAFGRDHGGIDVDFEDAPGAPPATTRLLLNADVGIGRAARAATPRRVY